MPNKRLKDLETVLKTLEVLKKNDTPTNRYLSDAFSCVTTAYRNEKRAELETWKDTLSNYLDIPVMVEEIGEPLLAIDCKDSTYANNIATLLSVWSELPASAAFFSEDKHLKCASTAYINQDATYVILHVTLWPENWKQMLNGKSVTSRQDDETYYDLIKKNIDCIKGQSPIQSAKEDQVAGDITHIEGKDIEENIEESVEASIPIKEQADVWVPFHLNIDVGYGDIKDRKAWEERLPIYSEGYNCQTKIKPRPTDLTKAENFLLDNVKLASFEIDNDEKDKLLHYGLYQEHTGKTLRKFFEENNMKPSYPSPPEYEAPQTKKDNITEDLDYA
ncbi:MAG: hypothetical protein GY941_22620 [Planctomycetes bacterium]|nr:hypothetical protein [Planctomycetota bacterium]